MPPTGSRWRQPSSTAHLQAVGVQTARASWGWAPPYFQRVRLEATGRGNTTGCGNEVGTGQPGNLTAQVL